MTAKELELEKIIDSQLNPRSLTPLQYRGIKRIADQYSEQQAKAAMRFVLEAAEWEDIDITLETMYNQFKEK